VGGVDLWGKKEKSKEGEGIGKKEVVNNSTRLAYREGGKNRVLAYERRARNRLYLREERAIAK